MRTITYAIGTRPYFNRPGFEARLEPEEVRQARCSVQLKQLATDYRQQKRTTWAVRGRIIIAQSKANYLSCTVPVVPPLG